MKKNPLIFISLILLTFLAPLLIQAQDKAQIKKERIQASYLLAFGRLPLPAELDWWNKQNDFTVAQLVDAHRNYMNKLSPGSKDDVIKKTYFIAFGRDPQNVQPGEVTHWKNRSEIFWEMLPLHVRWLNDNLKGRPDLYHDVIKAAYTKLFEKAATPAEVGKWNTQVRSFAELIFLLQNKPPVGYSIAQSAIMMAMTYYSDFSNVKFSNDVNNELIAITGGTDLYNKLKRGM